MALMVLGALGVAGAMLAFGGSDAPKPPEAPRAQGHGVAVRAAVGSFCNSSGCADAAEPPASRRSVPVHAGGEVRIDFPEPVPETVRARLAGRRYGRLRPGPRPGTWVLRIPGAGPLRGVLLLEARWPSQDAVFGVRLREHRHSGP